MKTLIATLLLFSSVSFAQDWYEKGNGGFVVTCPGKPQQVLDIYELENRFQIQTHQETANPVLQNMVLDLDKSESLDQRVQYLLSKIARLNPSRAQLYAQWYKSFPAEAEFLPGIHLNPIGDTGLAVPGEGCSLQQAVFQRAPGILNKFRYTIDLDLWNKLGPFNQAALLLHELIYREFSSPPSNHETSEESRYFNALVNSTGIQEMGYSDYLLTLQQDNVVRADYEGNPILLSIKPNGGRNWLKFALEFYDSNKVRKITFAGGAFLQQGDVSLSSLCTRRDPSALLAMATVSFDQNGHINDLLDTLLAYKSTAQSIPNSEQCSIVMKNSAHSLMTRSFRWTYASEGAPRISQGVFSLDTDGPWDNLLTFKNYSFAVDLSANPVSMNVYYVSDYSFDYVEFQGIACYSHEDLRVHVSNKSLGEEAPTIRFHRDQLSEEIQKLPRCPQWMSPSRYKR